MVLMFVNDEFGLQPPATVLHKRQGMRSLFLVENCGPGSGPQTSAKFMHCSAEKDCENKCVARLS